MEDLRELTFIVNKNKVRHIEPLLTKQDNSVMSALYEGLLDNQFATDEEAANFLYNINKPDNTYRKLKTRLKNRLINYLFFIDLNQPSYTERQQAYYECYKDWAATKILLGKHARVSAISLCYKVLRKSEKFEFTELTMDIARTLRLHYGTWEGDPKKYEQYNKLFKQYQKIWNIENEAEELYTDLSINYVNQRATDETIHVKAEEYYHQLQPYLHEYTTYKLHLCANLIKLMIYSNVGDHLGVIATCDETIDFFNAKNYIARVPLQICLNEKLASYIHLKQYEKGQAAVEECLKLLDEGSFNWFKQQELYFLLSMHTKHYQKAYKIFETATNNSRFDYLPPVIKEVWRIYEAYLYYLGEIGKIKLTDTADLSKFKVGKFLNETPIFSKDKEGLNVSILTIQVLFMIARQEYDAAIDRIEAIEKYCSRYLKKDETFRANCFIKMLLQIPACSFHKVAVERNSKKYAKRLKEVPLELTNQAYEIEIIPYEELWKLALNSLESSFVKV